MKLSNSIWTKPSFSKIMYRLKKRRNQKKTWFGNNAGSETYLQVIDKALLYIDLENTGVTYWCYIELENDSSSYIKER